MKKAIVSLLAMFKSPRFCSYLSMGIIAIGLPITNILTHHDSWIAIIGVEVVIVFMCLFFNRGIWAKTWGDKV